MITDIVAALIVGVVVFETIEHILFPIGWSLIRRRRKPLCGVEGISGKLVEVKEWNGGEGRILLEGEFWKAVSPDCLEPGDRAVVKKVDGLILTIAVHEKSDEDRHF